MSTNKISFHGSDDDENKIIENIYGFWFGENLSTWSKTYPLNTKLWFKIDQKVDQEIKENFEQYLLEASQYNSLLYQRLKTNDRGKLVLILMFDQFSRNIYRSTSKMFQFDRLALLLALNIIDDLDHTKKYSLPERWFIYNPLINSEILEHVRHGVDLLEQLAMEVSQRDVRRRYMANVRSAQAHLKLMEHFGRFPQRNQFLGRKATNEEENYLKTTSKDFVRAARLETKSKPVSTLNSSAINMDLTVRSPLKILVLHGFRQNSNSIKRSAKKLIRNLKGIATFYFANAPLPYNPTGELKEQLLATFGDENSHAIGYQRQWWNTSQDGRIYHHLDASLDYLDKLFKSEGPFDGVLGFSQGSALTGILCGFQPFGNISFRFAILISGFASAIESHQEIMKPCSIKGIPSIHIYGINDAMVTNEETLQLAAVFENPIIVSHPGGHFTPNMWPISSIKEFLLNNQQELWSGNMYLNQTEIAESQEFASFDDKIEATITKHKKQLSKLIAGEQKLNKISVVPIGLSKPMDISKIEEYIEHIDEFLLDDVMLLIWCKRSVFHNTELNMIDEEKHEIISPFIQYWTSLFLKRTDEIISKYLRIIPKYGSWTDLKTLYVHATHMEMIESQFSEQFSKLKSAIVRQFSEQLKFDYQIVLKQPDESANDHEQQSQTVNHEWISNCAKEAPRISNNRNNINTVLAKAIAMHLRPISETLIQDETKLKTEKALTYQFYRRLISSVCQVLEKVSPIFINEQMKSKSRKDRAFRLTKEQRETLLNAQPSTYITNPEPEPVVPCAIEDLQPLFEHLTMNKPGPVNDQQPVVFTRGTIMSGGRLDLCKQVVGPRGIQPLLDAMKNSEVVNRLLLGNNIVGMPGAQAISNYIRLNKESHIDTWYIAGNNFDSECISLICDALATDNKVKALWLKRNPLLIVGAKPIGSLLMANTYLQTLDLLNTGLLDEGCQIIFDAMKFNKTLRHLYLDTNGLTVKSGKIIRSHFELNENKLESLYLSCNALGDAGVCEIATGLKHDRCLQRLGLASNCIGPDGACVLTDVLIDHPSLLQLNLGFMKATILLGGLDNVIGDEGASHIARLIQSNNQIRSIDLTFNSISQRGLNQLKEALKTNKVLTTLKYLQYGQVHSDSTREEINAMLEQNITQWGKEVLAINIDNDLLLNKAECIQKGQQLSDDINYPPHVMEIISYYRTH